MRRFPLLLGASLLIAGCFAPETQIISGKLTLNTATHPKIACWLMGEADSDSALQAQISALANLETTSVTFASVVKPDSNGKYVIELKSQKPVAAFALYAWNDLNDNDKLDTGEKPTATVSKSDAICYTFKKTGMGYRWVKTDTDITFLESDYDFKL